eukprot:CAMPEP_0184699352 /NCGR_PEP_ID=MMETSP0313-20130426/5654_1 /TAXON_ID=2792 /ORGANISM="Porphyridium aerugineum, Strain SAG 1380-2" /LENGTH=64 /DNA_ID=CAMNT_0027158427 /DNA_START=1 /DNA_END=192 /DNA_ORIENTATION=+
MDNQRNPHSNIRSLCFGHYSPITIFNKASLAKPSISMPSSARKTSPCMFLDSGHRNGNGNGSNN